MNLSSIRFPSIPGEYVVLSSAYFFYFGILGVFTPFLGLFLDHRGYNSLDIGYLLATLMATRIIGPPLWASWADKTGKKLAIIRLGTALAFVSAAGSLLTTGYWALALALSLFSLFWTAILPQLEVMTFNVVKQDTGIYSRIRSLGSIGYIALVLLAGALIEQYSPEIFPATLAVLLVLLYVSFTGFSQPKVSTTTEAEVGSSFWRKLTTPGFMLFFLAIFLLQVSFGPFYGFFTLYTKSLGYSATESGMIISVGVIAEIFIFIVAGKFISAVGIKRVLILSLFLTALRWFVVARYGENWLLLSGVQLLHAASFGLVHAASIKFINQYFDENQKSRGQAIYIGGAYSGGGALGALISGYLWMDGAGAMNSFLFAAGASAAAGIVAMLIPTAMLNNERE